MAIGDRLRSRAAERREAMMAERDARRAERMAERLSRMADRPMRTPDPAPMVSRGPVGGPTRPVAPDLETPFRPRRAGGETLGSMLGGGTNALSIYGGDMPVRDMLGSGIGALSIYRPPVPQYAMPQPGQSYGSWLSSQIRGGVDFGNVDPRAVYNQGSDRPLPGVVPIPQKPTQFSGKGGQAPTQKPTQFSGKGGQAPTQFGGKGGSQNVK